MSDIQGLLLLPRLKIQNANTISSPLTWGFPAMTAFIGLMQALERRCQLKGLDLKFGSVGVVCHQFEAQVTSGGYTRAFHLTRNPVDKTGKTAAIVEEGRVHFELSLIFEVVNAVRLTPDERQAIARQVADEVASMRIAGGTVVPALPGERAAQPSFHGGWDDTAAMKKCWQEIRRRLLPGFALVLRDSLLQSHYTQLKERDPQTSLLDAWLDLSRLNVECHKVSDQADWHVRRDYPGWLVPIPVGYAGLTELHEPGVVTHARDDKTPFRCVESVYSIGQWVSPHRLRDPDHLLWYPQYDPDSQLYHLKNSFEDESVLP